MGQFTERQSAAPPPPPAFDEQVPKVEPAKAPFVPGSVRQSPPPPAPIRPFQDGRVPMGYEKAEAQRLQLQAEHARLKPQAAPTVTGNNLLGMAPPLNPSGIPFDAPRNRSPWPQTRWHRTKAPNGMVITSDEHEQETCTGKGWSNKPLPLEAAPPLEGRLDLLDEMLDLLASQAEDGELPAQTLVRIICERDDFARRAALKPPAPIFEQSKE